MLTDSQIVNIVSAELQQSAGGNENDFIDANRQRALATYLGQPDGKEVEGRSTIISTDVADAIEWIMPEIVKAFTQNNEVVTFDPSFDGDEDQAELESQYVYDILMKDNNGFLIIHQFIKDALMQKNGFIKVMYTESEEPSYDTYTGLSEIEYEVLQLQEDIEIVEVTANSQMPPVTPESLMQQKMMEEQHAQMTMMAEQQGQEPPPALPEPEPFNLYDVKVMSMVDTSKIEVISVPPEEFRINKMHNSVDVSSARFSAHVFITTAGDLVAEGYQKGYVDTLPSSQVYEDDRQYRFYMQNETVYPDGDVSADPANREIELSECYMKMDIDEVGVAELLKVTVSGGDNPDSMLDWEPINSNPFISATCILMSHKLFGLSIYDRLKQIQEQKTTLWRNIFDNMYLQNNQRTIVIEGQVNLDDLMISRPGGIIRAKTRDAVTPYVTPPLPQDSYKMMDYLDQVRASRAGVSPEGPITDSMIGDRVGSEGVANMMSQKEELVGLMIRVIAETGIKPLCYKIREQVIQHQNVAKDYMFRGQWVKVDPSKWKSRTHTTVRVGTGSGNRKEQMGAIGNIMMFQEKLLAMPGQSLITDEQTFNAINDYAKFSGMPSARRYVMDPMSDKGKQHKQMVQQKMEEEKQKQEQKDMALIQAQTDVAQAEVQKAEAQSQNVQLRNQNEQIKTEASTEKGKADIEIDMLEQRLQKIKMLLDEKGKTGELEFRYWEAAERFRIEELRIHTAAQTADKKESSGG